jgi:Ca2+-binding RTX toxin-like protein
VSGSGDNDGIAGGAEANYLDGEDGDDSINGLGGDDTLVGGAGDNFIEGGDGQDILRYDWAAGTVLLNLDDGFAEVARPGGAPPWVDALFNIEHAIGGSDNDTIIGSGIANFLLGAGGNDSLSGGAGNDTLFSGLGTDTLDGGAGFDLADFTSVAGNLNANLALGTESGVTGSAIGDVEGVLGGSGNDTLVGDDSINWLDGRGGNDTIQGMAGVDSLLGGVGNNVLDGMGGEDLAYYTWASAAVSVDLSAGRATHEGGQDTLSGIEHAVGTGANDTIAGSAIGNYLQGAAGADDVSGGGGNDTLSAGLGADTLDGGDGVDIVDFAIAAAGVRANLRQGIESTTNTFLFSMEGATGSNFADLLDGDENANWLDGRIQNDTLNGFESQDTIIGGLGQNILDGGAGGDDVVRYDWFDGPITVDLAAGTGSGTGVSDTLSGLEAVIGTALADTITGGAEDNYFQAGAGNDVLDGGAGDDTIASGDGVDAITGGAGVDLVDFGATPGAVFVNLVAGVEASTGTTLATVEAAIASNFNDTLTGDGENNYLDGRDGNDTLDGGGGSDSLIGGAGADVILFDDFEGYDAVFGFQSGVDVIDARAYADGDPDFQVNIFQVGGDLVIQFENNDNLYLVGKSLATFDAETDLLL